MVAQRVQTGGHSDTIRLVLNGECRTIHGVDPNMTVLSYLREALRATGTKEGCAEGDCGACTVVVAELEAGAIRYRAVNACIQFLATLDGKELITVEGLSGHGTTLHPVQQAMVECHASQCGFCTPGFVMSLFALYKSEFRPSRRHIDDALAGNLCRCTGYRPIIAAAERMYAIGAGIPEAGRDRLTRCPPAPGEEPGPSEREARASLRSVHRDATLALRAPAPDGGERRFFAPREIGELASLVVEHGDACLLAGGTDVGLWVTKGYRDLDTLIYLGNVAGLHRLAVTDSHIEVGAAVTLGDAHALIARHYPDFGELLRRFASPPIRNAGTLVGNIANGSPIGDSMPALIVLGATLVLRHGERTRELELDAFYLGYQKTALARGELVERVRIPLAGTRHEFRTYKVSKRFDQDISAVCAAFCLEIEAGRVHGARICYGGLAETPSRARRCEQALVGQAWCEGSLDAARAALDEDFSPITDMRASAAYRRRVAGNLLRRFLLETTVPDLATRVAGYQG